MKTLEEFFEELAESAELRDEIGKFTDKDAFADWLKKHDCAATPEEFKEYLVSNSECEISDDDAENAAGGWKPGRRPPQFGGVITYSMRGIGGTYVFKVPLRYL